MIATSVPSAKRLAAVDGARDLAGDVILRAAEAIEIRRRDLDRHAVAAAAPGDAEPAVRPARQRHDRLRPRLAGQTDAALHQREIGRRADHAAAGKRLHCARRRRERNRRRRLRAGQSGQQAGQAAGDAALQRLEREPHREIRQPQRQRLQHVIELLAADHRRRERAGHGARKCRRAGGKIAGAQAERAQRQRDVLAG